ncbi:MAG: DnaJ domain-containing protein [Myxococcota bacterium]
MSFRERLFRIARAEWSAAQRRLFDRAEVDPFEPEPFEDPGPVEPSPKDGSLASAYEALELPEGASAEAAKKAYRHLMKRYHPDLFPEPEDKAAATRLAQGLRAAYERIQAHERTRKAR